MGINAKDLIEQIIRPSLFGAGLLTMASEQLLAGTCAQESQMGSYLKQAQGAAKGIFQMESATHDDIWANYLRYHQELARTICKISYIPVAPLGVTPFDDTLIYNLRYACLMARVKYVRDKAPLPAFNDITAQADYWKRIYNTVAGKGDTAAYINNYNRFVKGYYQSS